MKRLKDAIKAQTDYTIAVSILMLNKIIMPKITIDRDDL